MDTQRIIDKLDQISEKQSEMSAILAVQAQQLREHMRRTETLEMLAQDYRADSERWQDKMFERMKPVEDHISMMKGAAKVIGVGGAILGFVLGALKLFLGN